MNRQPLGDTDSSYVTLCDAMKHHIATTAQTVQHIHSITFPPHMLILQKGYYDYDDIFEAAASIFQSDNSSLYIQFYGQLDGTTAADPHRLTSYHLSLHWDTSCCIRSPLTGDNLLQTSAIAKPVFHAKKDSTLVLSRNLHALFGTC